MTPNESPAALLPTFDELTKRLGTPDPVFSAWRDSVPDTHWIKLDLSALRIGYELGLVIASTAPVASESRGSVPEGWMPIETLAKDHKARFILRRETPFIGYWDAKEGVWKDDGGLLRDPTEWLPTSLIRTAAPTPPAVASGEPPDWAIAQAFRESESIKGRMFSVNEAVREIRARARELAEQSRAGKEGG